ncbi:MAG: class I SAM-dependent methyltransferase [Actinomycetota bacterium]
MRPEKRDYAEIYRTRTWAYSDKPDPELIRALAGIPRGRAVDLGGGQGRHALTLSALGFDAVLVDSVVEGLHQATAAADERGLPLHTVHSDALHYEPDRKAVLVVAALLFHLPSPKKSVQICRNIGEWLEPGGLFYLSIPGFTREIEEFVRKLIEAAGCREQWVVKHLVTKRERPRLPVSRRNETRALGRRSERAA